MSAIQRSVPGDIPGLLRTCSPLIRESRARTVELILHPDGEHPLYYFAGVYGCFRIDDWRLNLDVPTGAAHAAVWVSKWIRMGNDVELQPHEQHVIERAVWHEPLPPEDIDLLARLVLRLAGRTP